MKMLFIAFALVGALSTLTHVGCGGRDATVIQAPATEPEDTSAEAAEVHPEEYADMANPE